MAGTGCRTTDLEICESNVLTTTPPRPHLLYKIKYMLSLAALLGAPNEKFKIFDANM